ncbi:MAG: hypothetical protein SP1CHLAM54_12710 [Chlamydiia bacterium]|nr:hypothetical protein [Chlamydiia bacterium]MCH9616168.1 hypothetical protein [Chlamydiia bacterium]MCH9629846.1 hypothetical protein [Chlamydiia bacterium]
MDAIQTLNALALRREMVNLCQQDQFWFVSEALNVTQPKTWVVEKTTRFLRLKMVLSRSTHQK